MKSLVDHLSQYAAYHRDPHTIVTHFVGIGLEIGVGASLLAIQTARFV
ncbi:Mpo1-like protein [Pseudomonas psychrophila]